MSNITRTALTHRCPSCHEGPLYVGMLKIAPECSHCGLSFGAEDAGDGPAFIVILVVGFLATALAGIVEVLFEWPLWLHALVWIPLTFILSIILLRISKSGLIAWQYNVRLLGEKE